MFWLLFMDESGHDHKNTPLEVRGGVALHAKHIWDFTNAVRHAGKDIFGVSLAEFGIELKGSKLLGHQRFTWANRSPPFRDLERQQLVRRFLDSKRKKTAPKKDEFTAYGQASLMMVTRIFELLFKYEAKLFAAAIPRGIKPPRDYRFSDFLRKDQNFLLERYFWFLEKQGEHGLLVMDQSDKNEDRRFLKRIGDYFEKSQNGRRRAQWIVPTPLFVDSELSAGVQAADICIYCVNWGFRRREWEFTGQSRDDIRQAFGGNCGSLQFQGESYDEISGKKF
jgi:hypothetical protein